MMSEAIDAATEAPTEGKEPAEGLAIFRSTKIVRAGPITEVVEAGCYVREADGTAVLRLFEPNMTARYQPKVGDFWIVYPDGYQALCPCFTFLNGYVPNAPAAEDPAVTRYRAGLRERLVTAAMARGETADAACREAETAIRYILQEPAPAATA